MGSWRAHRSGSSLRRKEAVEQLGLLLVDDEPNILDSLREVFKRYTEVHVASSAQEALDLFREHGPKIVVSDQRMPGMTGIELMAQIKELNPDTARILLTGYSDINVVIQALNNGLLFKYLTKPWEQQDLVATVLAGANAYLRQVGAIDETPSVLGC